MTRTLKARWLLCSIMLTLGLSISAKEALADLQVFPTRLTIDSRARTGVFNLRHVGQKTTRYRITPVFYRMNNDGSMSKIETPEPSDHYAGDMVIFSPRMVVLEPQKEQVVRIQVRRPADLQAGEYRMYLQFETFDDADAMAVGQSSEAGVNMALKAHRAIAVPIIIHHGQVDAQLAMKEAKIAPDQKEIAVDFEKTGNRSVYGDMALEYKTKDGWALISEIRGVAIYNQQRQVTLAIDASKVPKSAPLRISFTEGSPRGVNVSSELPALQK